MGKIIFFDVDGTLVDDKGMMLASTKEALRKAKENGHHLIVCSGRCLCQVDEEIMKYGFDGFITSAGANIHYKDEFVKSYRLTLAQRKQLVNYFETYKIPYMLQCENRLLTTEYSFQKIVHMFDPATEDTQKMLRRMFHNGEIRADIATALEELEDIEKAVYFQCPNDAAHVEAGIGAELFREDMSFDRGDSSAGEITLAGHNKATGMKELMEYLGVKQEDTIAFGDGPNDYEMIEFAGIGVAMGNAKESLKQKADLVTTRIEEHGIYEGMKKLGLI